MLRTGRLPSGCLGGFRQKPTFWYRQSCIMVNRGCLKGLFVCRICAQSGLPLTLDSFCLFSHVAGPYSWYLGNLPAPPIHNLSFTSKEVANSRHTQAKQTMVIIVPLTAPLLFPIILCSWQWPTSLHSSYLPEGLTPAALLVHLLTMTSAVAH